MLRPLPHRGDVVAAGAVALAALVALLQVRFDDAWDKGIHFLYAAAALAFVGTLALRAPREGDAPRAYQSALLAVTFALAVPTLARLSLLLGSDGLDSSGTLAWAGAALAALGFGLAAARGSALCVLLGAVSLVLAVLGFVDLVFSPDGVHDLPLAAARARRRASRPPPSPAATTIRRAPSPSPTSGGLTALALALTLVRGSGLRLLAALRPRRGHRLGALPVRVRLRAVRVLGRRPRARARGGSASRSCWPRRWPPPAARRRSLGWPLVLAVGAGGLLVIGLRPSRPLPPAPVARRGPRLRDQERAVSDLKEALDRALARRPRAPPRQGARAGQAAGARARRAAARRRLVRRGGAAGQLGRRRPGRRRRRHRPGPHRRAARSR